LDHLSDGELLRALARLVVQERTTTAELIAHIGEVDARRLHVPAGCPSIFEYCVRELNLTEAAAFKRIQVARSARDFPALFTALAQGQLNLTGVLLLGPHLSPGNADELILAAAGRSNSEIEALIASRFPRQDVPTKIQPLPVPAAKPNGSLAPERVETMFRRLHVQD
jgi:hypothetical protein